MFLLDTNVVSELRRAAKADPRVLAWSQATPVTDTFLSAITLLELERGVLLVERRDKSQGLILRTWLENRVLPHFDGRILPVDAAVARLCARLHVPDPRAERDALIAATSMVHAMTVVTRNVADFQMSGVKILAPWTM
jgi:toxin FitB